jgi:hypothetical protein
MGNRKYDYDTMKREYVTGDESLRGLAERFGLATNSTVSVIAKNEDWEGARADYRKRLQEKEIDALAEKRAQKVAEIEQDTLETIHAAVIQLAISLQDRVVEDPVSGTKKFIPAQQVTPDGLTKLIDKFLVMSGQVTNREAHLGFTLTASTEDIPREVLRDLRRLATEQGAGAGPMGQSPLPRITGPKQVN